MSKFISLATGHTSNTVSSSSSGSTSLSVGTATSLYNSTIIETGTEGGTTTTMSLFLTETGDTSPISINDLHQGQIGDCFLITAMGELARTEPLAIENMIIDNGNGTQSVRLFEASNGSLPNYGTSSFKAVWVTVTDNFQSTSVNNGSTQDVVNGVKEIWPQVLEQAIAQLNGGYSTISNGGYPAIAMEELTGQRAYSYSASSVSQSLLTAWSNANDMISLDTSSSNSTYNLVGNHAYMFEGLTVQNGTTYVKAGNPWGFDQPSLIPVSALGSVFVQVDVGRPT